MSVLLACIATITLTLSCIRFGWNSLVSLALLGTYIYTSPGFLNMMIPFHQTLGARGVFGVLSNDTLIALCLVWATLFLMTAAMPVPRRRIDPKITAPDPRWNGYLVSCIILGVLGFTTISIMVGPLYFLQDRNSTEVESSFISLIWRWILVFGAVISIRLHRWISLTLFTSGLMIHFVAGDRTIPAITVTAILLMTGMLGVKRKAIPPPKYIVFGFLAFFFLLIGKPIYLAVKLQSLDGIDAYLNRDAFLGSVMSFEPLLTINILDYSITNNLTMPFGDFLLSTFGNILIIPSAFGVNTNYFNTFFTSEMPASLSFGIAGNFYAHGYVVLGFPGIVIFAFLFFCVIFSIERKIDTSTGMAQLTLVIIGATIAIYLQRNGADNILSFIRQILIATLLIWITDRVIRLLIIRRHRVSTFRT